MKKVAQVLFLLFWFLLLYTSGNCTDPYQNAFTPFKMVTIMVLAMVYGHGKLPCLGYQAMQWLDRPDREERKTPLHYYRY